MARKRNCRKRRKFVSIRTWTSIRDLRTHDTSHIAHLTSHNQWITRDCLKSKKLNLNPKTALGCVANQACEWSLSLPIHRFHSQVIGWVDQLQRLRAAGNAQHRVSMALVIATMARRSRSSISRNPRNAYAYWKWRNHECRNGPHDCLTLIVPGVWLSLHKRFRWMTNSYKHLENGRRHTIKLWDCRN